MASTSSNGSLTEPLVPKAAPKVAAKRSAVKRSPSMGVLPVSPETSRRLHHYRFVMASVLLLVAGVLVNELTRPQLLLVGNITVDLVDGKTPTGGAISYAAVVAAAHGVRACVVTAAGPEANLGVFAGHDLHVVHTDHTLTFEHTYTWWGNRRKLRVTAQPNVTLAPEHVPRRCRRARTVLLGPLTQDDMDVPAFAAYRLGFIDRLLGGSQRVGLMAQGQQRVLEQGTGRVLPLKTPSADLEESLRPGVSVFLSDVETDVWSAGTLESLAARCDRFVVTRGELGADEYLPPGPRWGALGLLRALGLGGAAAAAAPGSSGSSSGGSRVSAGSSSSGRNGSGGSNGSNGGASGGGSSSSSGGSSGGGGVSLLSAAVGPVVRHEPFKVEAVDTNGAGDTFATSYMLAIARGDPAPGAAANWAASRAVMQSQDCKPECAGDEITKRYGGALAPLVWWARHQLEALAALPGALLALLRR